MDGLKECRKCGEELPLEMFFKYAKAPDGFQYWCKNCSKSARKKWADERPEKMKEYRSRYGTDYMRQNKYGLTPEQYQTMLENQGYCCAVCTASGPLVVDHDHNTGEVRGILCSRCNLTLGNVQDNADLLVSLAAYIVTSTNKERLV